MLLAPAAFLAVQIPTSRAAPASRAEQEFLAAYRKAHERRDPDAALSLVHWEGETPEIRQMTERMIRGLVNEPLKNLRIEPVDPKAINVHTSNGVTYAPNLKPVAQLKVELRDGSTGASSWGFLVGIKDGKYRISIASPVSRSAPPRKPGPGGAADNAELARLYRQAHENRDSIALMALVWRDGVPMETRQRFQETAERNFNDTLKTVEVRPLPPRWDTSLTLDGVRLQPTLKPTDRFLVISDRPAGSSLISNLPELFVGAKDGRRYLTLRAPKPGSQAKLTGPAPDTRDMDVNFYGIASNFRGTLVVNNEGTCAFEGPPGRETGFGCSMFFNIFRRGPNRLDVDFERADPDAAEPAKLKISVFWYDRKKARNTLLKEWDLSKGTRGSKQLEFTHRP